MRDCLFRKGLVLIIILLFIGVGVYPAFAINIKTSYDSSNTISGKEKLNNEIVKTFVRIHEPDGIKSYPLTITENQKDELDAFFDSFKQELDEAETFEETTTIYNNAIITLDKIGFIPKGISVEKIQQLITGNAQLKSLKNIKHINKKATNGDIYQNLICYVTGSSTETGPDFTNPFRIFSVIIYFFTGVWIGDIYYGSSLKSGHTPADGWIYTNGLLGEWRFEGKFYGQLYESPDGFWFYYYGVTGYVGLFYGEYYIGHAMRVKIGNNAP